LRAVLAVALLSLKEGLRQRLLYGVLIFSLAIMTFAVLVSGMFMRDISKVILDFCLSAISIGGLLIPFFLAIDLLSKDIERKTIVTILAQPVSRTYYILGKFIGIALLTAVTMLVLTCSAMVAVWGGKIIYGDIFFTNLSCSAIFISIGLGWLGILVLNAMVILWCCLTTSSFLATMLTVATYFIGHSIDDIVRFIASDTPGVEISASIQKTVHIAQYLFPNLSVFDFKLLAAHGIIPPVNDILFCALYGGAYIGCALSLATIVFHRRDLA